MHRVAEMALILDQVFELVEFLAGAILDQRTPEIDQLLGGRRRRQAGQALAHHQRQRILDRRVGAIGDVLELAAVKALVEHGRQVHGDAVHAPRADGLDARLFHRLEYRARLLAGRLQAAMQRRHRGRQGARRSKSALPRTIAASALLSLRGGSGSRTLPPIRPGRSAANETSRSGLRASARKQPVTARLNGSVGDSFDDGLLLIFEAITAPS